jgi:hypothetical protein
VISACDQKFRAWGFVYFLKRAHDAQDDGSAAWVAIITNAPPVFGIPKAAVSRSSQYR